MMSRRFIFIVLPLVVMLYALSAAHARLLHESARIALYLEKAEPESRNSQPVKLEADRLAAALSRLRARSAETGGTIVLFPEKNCQEVAAQLVKALAGIDAGRDLHLVSFRHVGTLFSGQRNASAARVFMENGHLNLIFGQIDQLYSEFRDPDRPVPPMGTRRRGALLKGGILPADGVTFVDGRDDWVALELAPAKPPVPAAGSDVETRDRTAGMAAPDTASDVRGRTIEAKLQILKNLRDKDLITEQEYVEKKRKILDGL